MGMKGFDHINLEGAVVRTIRLPGDPERSIDDDAQKHGPARVYAAPPARYTRPDPDAMNKLEARYAAHLEALKRAGEIFDWAFQPEKFRLANIGDRCYVTPDFRVQLIDGTIEFHETKGFMEPDAEIKYKWFVASHPYPLVLVRWVKGGWSYERREP